ncbi:hypothetical protein OESDEN_10060, partial [Oesophagostomum dentatum]
LNVFQNVFPFVFLLRPNRYIISSQKLILGYVSGSLPLPNPEDQQSIEAIEEAVRLHYVRSDVTRPQREEDDHSKCQLILHCVDNSGAFGDRGIFATLRAKDPSIADRYELISRMGDLRIGDTHLISDVKELRADFFEPNYDSAETEGQPSTSSHTDEAVILFVAQSSKRRGNISDHGVPTYIYYFAKPHRPPPALAQPAAPPVPKKRPNPSPRGPSKRAKAKRDSGDVVNDGEEEEMEEDDEESDSSSASSSASEHDWSEENDEDEEEEGSDDEDEDEDESSDEEITDEELEDLKIKRRRRSSRTAVRHQARKRKSSEGR